MDRVLFQIIFFIGFFYSTLQNCPEEKISSLGVNLTWHQTPSKAKHIESNPLCYFNKTLVTRDCSGSRWTPALDETETCSSVVRTNDLLKCPRGFYKISADNSNYCYKIHNATAWNYPCLSIGAPILITELSLNQTEYLINSLKTLKMSRYFWLPAKRPKLFHPLVWTIPGPNWGQSITSNLTSFLNMPVGLSKSCLSLDIEERSLKTNACTEIYPSLCLYTKDIPYPGLCPNGFYSFKLMPHKGLCYDIVTADTPKGLTFHEFQNTTCNQPMLNNSASRFIFEKIAILNDLPDNIWCWFKRSAQYLDFDDAIASNVQDFEGIINNAGVIGLMDSNLSLPCMACETEVVEKKTELMFEYNNEHNLIYLTVYYQSGLWKYKKDDKGIRCFSNANGFSRTIDVNDVPLIEITPLERDIHRVEKVVYIVDLVANTSAQYWCEGHTNTFSFITTEKIVVNPKGNETHVFSLVIKYYILINEVESMNNLSTLTYNIGNLFKATKVLLMEVLSYGLNHMLILFHLHVAVDDKPEDKAVNIQETLDTLTNIAETKLIEYNCTFVNISSSVYCLPTTSMNKNKLDWELTPVGHISAPSQFCLQSNGLPVKRHCEGSYTIGAIWGEIEGYCDNTYEPSETTVLLYGFVNGRNTFSNKSKFLTEGLSAVFKDTDIIIPADIYYLSMSLQQISDIAQANDTVIDTNIEHIAWVMDRVMILDDKYLRLAQTLNSTNVIVDSISDIIESITKKQSAESSNVAYQIAVEPKFIVQVTYPELNNVTGIAVIRDTSSEYFTDMSIQPLYKNTTIDEILSIKNLEIATWLPTNLINSIQMLNHTKNETDANNNIHITITIYQNNAVFQELHEHNHTINSRIIGITIPGYISNLEYAVPIIFKQMNQAVNPFCGYWDFEPKLVTHIPGSWKRQGCFTASSIGDVKVCECYHLTHFGYLFFTPPYPDDNSSKYITHSVALNVITLVGSFLSLLGIAGIWITALIFGNWRKKAGTKVLLQLSTSIALPLIFIIIFNLDYSILVKEDELYTIAPHMEISCIVLGALLHFSILASFMWMLITAVLQFIRYVRVLGVRRPARFMLKFTLIGWGIPFIPVIITLALDPHNYIPASSTIKNICYPSGPYLIGAVLVPICLILLINVVLFLLVLHAISRGSDSKTKSTDMDLIGAQLRVSVFLFFLLGLTWLFGIFSFSNNLMWSYLFCLTSTLQGLVLFIYFVICDPNTRGLWVTLMKPQLNTSSCRNSITSISTG